MTTTTETTTRCRYDDCDQPAIEGDGLVLLCTRHATQAHLWLEAGVKAPPMSRLQNLRDKGTIMMNNRLTHTLGRILIVLGVATAAFALGILVAQPAHAYPMPGSTTSTTRATYPTPHPPAHVQTLRHGATIRSHGGIPRR